MSLNFIENIGITNLRIIAKALRLPLYSTIKEPEALRNLIKTYMDETTGFVKSSHLKNVGLTRTDVSDLTEKMVIVANRKGAFPRTGEKCDNEMKSMVVELQQCQQSSSRPVVSPELVRVLQDYIGTSSGDLKSLVETMIKKDKALRKEMEDSLLVCKTEGVLALQEAEKREILLQTKLNELETRIDEAHGDEIIALQSTIERLTYEAQLLRQDVQEKVNKSRTFQTVIDELRTQLGENTDRVTKFDSDVERLQESDVKTQSQCDEMVNALKERLYNAEFSSATDRTEREKAEAKVARLLEDLAASTDNVNMLNTKLAQIEAEKNKCNSDFDELTRKYLGLSDENTEVLNRFNTLQSRYGDLEGRYGDLEGRYGDLEGRYGDLEGRYGESKSRIEELEKIKDRMENVEQLENRILQAKNRNIESQEQLRQLREEHDELSALYKKVSQERDNLSRGLGLAKNRNIESQAQIRDVRSSYLEKSKSLDGRLAQAQKRVEGLERQYRLKQELDDLETNYRKDMNSFREEISEMLEILTQAEKERDNLQSERDILESDYLSDINGFNKEADELKNALARAKQRNIVNIAELRKTNSRVTHLEDKYAKFKAKAREANAQNGELIDSLSSQADSLKEQVAKCDREQSLLREQYNVLLHNKTLTSSEKNKMLSQAMRNSEESLRKIIEERDFLISELESDLGECKADLAQCNENYDEVAGRYQVENNELRSELNRVKEEANVLESEMNRLRAELAKKETWGGAWNNLRGI